MLRAVREFIVRLLLKDSPKGVMTTLPNKDLVDMNVQMLAEKLMRNGVDPNSLKNANQVENAINMIENKSNVRQGIKSTKSADIFELQMPPKKIDPKKGIIGGRQIPDDDLPPPGSRGGKDDIAAPVQSAEETIKNMIEAENKKNIGKMRNRKMVKDAIDNVSPGFVRGDRKYNAQLVAEDLADKKFGKEFYDLDQKQQMDLYGEALDGLSVDLDDFAQGGRAGFSNGGIDVLKLEDEAFKRALNAFKYYQSTGGKKNFKDYIKESGRFGDQFRAEGGRIGYKDGPDKPGRRKFMKIMGGLATIPFIGKFFKGAKTAAPAVEKAVETVTEAPSYFFDLVAKIKLLGEPKRTPSYRERVKEYQYTGKDGNEYLLTEELDTGDIMIQKDKRGGR